MTARRNGTALLQSFAQGPVLLEPDYIPALRALAETPNQSLITGIANALGLGDTRARREEMNTVTNDHLCLQMGLGPSDRSKPFAFSQGVAVIPVYGTLLHRDNWCDSYATGYDFIRSRFHAALNDQDVKGIVFDINSGGGHVAGNFELCDEIVEARGKKPTLGIIDNACYSGAYSLGSTLDRLVSTPSGGAGSIGVVMMHASVQGLLAKHGVEISFIHAGAHKMDGNPFQNLSEDVRARFQTRVETSYDKFVSMVARNRGIEADAVRATEAQCFTADEALSRGLIDAVQTPAVALAAFFASLDGSDTSNTKQKGATMTHATGGDGTQAAAPNTTDATTTTQGTGDITTTAPATAPTADAAQTERDRCSGILGCEEAKGREQLANHLAFKTAMSVEDAKAMLLVAPKSEAAKPTANSAFAAAMDGTQNPNIDAGASAPAELSAGERIAKSYQMATGSKSRDTK